MATHSIGEMSLQELTALIDARIRQSQVTSGPKPYLTSSSRAMEDVLASMRRNLWTPPADAPGTGELLRQDRDR